MKKFLSAAAVLTAAVSLYSAVIVENGQAKVQIVVPSGANNVESYAAQELAEHLKLISGKDVPVVSIPSGKVPQIRLGRAAKLDISKLPGNSALVKIGEADIDIAGIDGEGSALKSSVPAGTLFGVYEFLERELGVRWLWPGKLGTIAPAKNNIKLDPNSYLVDPPMDSAGWRFYGSGGKGWASEANRRKFNHDTHVWLRRHRFNSLVHVGYGHAYINYMKLYYKDNPELFNLLPNGKRISDPTYFNGRADLVSMCVSNPDLVKRTVADWVERGTNTMLNVNENDTAGKCVCANCLALDNNPDKDRVARAKKRFDAKDRYWYSELGSLSDRYAAFYLAVQKEADKIKPGNRMVGCIYGNYYEAPTKLKLNDRIIMRFCPPLMYPWTDAKIAMFKRLWKGWADAGVSLMLRPNFTHDGHNFPLMYHRQFAECFDFARDNGLKYSDFDSLTSVFGVNGITHYVIAAKNYSGRDKSVSELENEYLSAFGKAAPAMREWLELMTAATAKGYSSDDNSVEGSSYYTSFYEVADLVFTPEVMKKGRELLEAAEKAAAGDAAALERVKFVRAGYEDAAIVLEVQKGVVLYQKTGDTSLAAKAMNDLAKFRKENEHLGYCDLGLCYSREARKWPMHLAQLGGNSKELTNWTVAFDPDNKGVSEKWFSNIPAGTLAVKTDNHLERSEAYAKFTENRAKERIPAWYINKFNIAKVNNKQALKLTFGAVDGNADIYLNGKLIHSRKYPHNGNGDSWKEPFDVDVTGKIRAGENVLAVRITKDNRFGGMSGIWRSVFLSAGKVNVANIPVKGWVLNAPMGKFTGKNSAYPLILSCKSAGKAVNAYQGVWGRFYRNEKVTKGLTYEVVVHFKQKGKSRFEMWVRTDKSGLGKNNINVAGPNEDNAERTLTARFTAGGSNAGIYLNLLKGIGEVEIYSIKMYPATEL